MPKRKKLFSVETSDKKINMNVDDASFRWWDECLKGVQQRTNFRMFRTV